MQEVSLVAEAGRHTGSPSSRRLRAAGKVPAVLYGHGIEPQSLAVEAKALRAAVLAAQRTGVAVVSHSPSGAAFQQQLDELEREGGDPARFVQVHANSEKDFTLHLRALQRGAWLEYDGIGGSAAGDDWHLELVQRVLHAGFADRLLLSQDVVGWRAGTPGGGNYVDAGQPKKRYAHLVDTFLPRLREAGVSDETVHQITVDNPRRLLAFSA